MLTEMIWMSDLIEELESKRNRLNTKADKHRRKRDKLNIRTREWAQKRDELNSKVKNLIRQANEHRATRDEFNQIVQEVKSKREELNKEFNRRSEELNRLKRERLPQSGVNIQKLKKEIRALEFKQQTQVLSSDKERAIVENLSRKMDLVKEQERVFEENSEVREAMESCQEARDCAEEEHRKVSQFADKAQKEHDAMVQHYEKADELRRKADKAQEKFLESKNAADKEHQAHIEMIRQVHDFDKIIAGLRQKKRRAAKKKTERSARREAEAVFERFKRGEKLSTEDLLSLQKAGYL